ncbi:putative Mycophenolic acid acyl-glucuronide esterase, mitochondrial [Hypsibius exemplaris]|uniref:Mycophenolic acid acyl-glucuronide esterase, mitochondrial n=1 Tax=Hypsibius exemplaris TaxID=2072580 RepID=A0A1W0XE92_HYPEX|nr:putative Mycophenolic acid acyl-glucuronide esterase, mitochondrial [Hypsibius exemplaris]
MAGEKAMILEQYCSIHNHSFIRFDYRGLGESSGDRQSFTPADWLSDALTVLDTLTGAAEPQVLVGSSMGALLMLHVAMKRPEKVVGVVGIALPFDYPSRLQKLLTTEMKAAVEKGGTIPSGRGDFTYNKKFLEDGLKLGFDHDTPIQVNCPVRLLHGVRDDEVPWDLSPKLMSLVDSTDVQVTISKSSDHRFSEPQDLQILVNTVDQLLKQYEFYS